MITLKSKTLVCTPCYRGEVVMQYAHSLVRDTLLAAADGHFVGTYYNTNTLIHLARHQGVVEFMRSDYDYLVFIDADTGWTDSQGALGDLLALPADMDVVAAICRRRAEPCVYPFTPLAGVPVVFPICEIETAGACFMRITRACVERIQAKFPGERLFDYRRDPRFEVVGEDASFCLRAREAGCRVWGKFDVMFDHVGPHNFKGRAMDDMAKQQGFTLQAGERSPSCIQPTEQAA